MAIPNRTVPTRKLPAPLYGLQKKIRNRKLSPEEIAWDDYLIPGLSWPVLRNKVGLKNEPYGCPDEDVLATRETGFTAFRMLELRKKPITGNFDLAHMKKIHTHLFQDVYEWAGKPRTVFLSKGGHDYADQDDVETLWAEQHRALEADNMLRDITDPTEFAEQLAFHWGMVNVAHAFREGNTRSQTIFFHQLAEQAGWDLNVAMLGPNHSRSIRDEFIEARFHHQSNGFDEKPLALALAKALTRHDPELTNELGKARAPHVWAKPKQALPALVLPDQALADPVPAVKVEPVKVEIEHDERFRRFPELVQEPRGRHLAAAPTKPDPGGPEL